MPGLLIGINGFVLNTRNNCMTILKMVCTHTS